MDPKLFPPENPVFGLLAMIGRTPLLEIRFSVRGAPRRIFAKYESMNLSGSIKDRMALYILGRAYEEGRIREGDEIVEVTSGNTGISFSAVGRALGHPVRIFMPNWLSEERVKILQGFGAEVVPVAKEDGGFLGAIRLAEEWASRNDRTFLPKQFSTDWNVEAHYRGTGPEILDGLRSLGLRPDAFVAGVGTGGTVMGVGRFLKERVEGVKIHPMEPSNSPVLSTGRKGGVHRIQGISDEFVPEIVKLEELDEIVSVADGDAILMAQRLSRFLGLAVGISSGANVCAALKVLEEQDPETIVVTVLPDSNKKYLSTDLFSDEPERSGYLSPHVRPKRVRAFRCP